jgi:hypothetical protein
MADNAPEPPKKVQPPLPSSGTTGRLKAPTTKLPPMQAGATGKVVVMLSSVAKPTNSQKILPPPVIPGGTPVVTGPMSTPTKIAPPLTPTTGNVVRQPPPLPGKKHMPVAKPLPAEERLSTTTFVKLPPKTAAPAFVSLVPKPAVVPDKAETPKVAPPLLPPKRAEAVRPPEPAPAKSEKKKTGIIKLNAPAADKPASAKPDDTIFAEIPEPAAPPVPEGWQRLQTGELPLPPGGLKESDPFQQSRKIEPTPVAQPSVVPIVPVATKADDKPADKASDKPAAKPPPVPPLNVEPAPTAAKAEPTLNPAPVPLAPAHPVHVAPPLVEKGHGHEETSGKLAQPHMPESGSEASKTPETDSKPPAAEPPKA